MEDLFQFGEFRLASGQDSEWKIECDAISGREWMVLAHMLVERLPNFGSVEYVPTGGFSLALAICNYATRGPLLIVDDVWTTGGSMEKWRDGRDAIGAVVFARGPVADWVMPLFQMPRLFSSLKQVNA